MKDEELEEELAQAKLSFAVLSRVGGFLRPYRRPIALGLGMEVVWCLSYLLGPHLVRVAIDDYLQPGALWGLIGVAALYGVNAFARAFWVGRELKFLVGSGERVIADLRKALYAHVQELSMSFYDRTRAGRIIARLDRDVDALEHPIVWGPITVVSAIVLLSLGSASMMSFDWRLALVVLACAPSLAVSSEAFRRLGMRAYRQARAALSQVTAHYAETIAGMKVIQASVQEPASVAKGRELIEGMRAAAVRAVRAASAYLPVVGLHYGMSAAAVLLFGGRLVVSGELTLGELVAFLMLLEFVFQPIEELGELYNELLSAGAAAERVFQVLDTQPEVRDRPGARAWTRARGVVEFDRVRFRYAAGSPWVVRDVSFRVAPGTTAAFVGETGAGKSSIAALLCRFYETVEGKVLLDGRDVRDLTLASLRRHIAVIPQDGYLFGGTVMENLRFGKPEASEAEIVRASEDLGAHALLAGLPEGYATEVGERGSRLSHGQRQAVCYVRALLADPRVLVLDEATSSLDAATERALQEALKRLAAGRTTVVIAHRLSTIRDADRIFVVHGGEIVEEGRHAELVGLGGRYARLYGGYASSVEAWRTA